MICVRSAEAGQLKLLFFSQFFILLPPSKVSLSYSLCRGCPIMPIRSTTTSKVLTSFFMSGSVCVCVPVTRACSELVCCNCNLLSTFAVAAACVLPRWAHQLPLLLLQSLQLLSLIVVAIECSLSFLFTYSISSSLFASLAQSSVSLHEI